MGAAKRLAALLLTAWQDHFAWRNAVVSWIEVRETPGVDMQTFAHTIFLAIAWLVLAACTPPPQNSPAPETLDVLAPVGEVRPGLMEGFLHGQPPLNSVVFVPAPPSPDSPEEQADIAANEAAQTLRDTARWQLASRDANLRFPEAAATFQCAAQIEITEASTPALYRLLQRSLTDFGLATYPAKTAYERPRPFLANGQPICTPDDRDALANDGSYPSGHSAIGWGWALVLSQLLPERAEIILKRGKEYVFSRSVCNVHWQSDTEAGMAVAAGAFARLQNNALYLATVAAARKEVAQAAALPDSNEVCAGETEAIALGRS